MYQLTSMSVDFGIPVLDLLIVGRIQRKLTLLLVYVQYGMQITGHRATAFRRAVIDTLYSNQI